MQVAYSVTYDNGDHRTYSVDEPFPSIEHGASWLHGVMCDLPTIQLGTTIVNLRHVRSISIREDKMR